MALLKKVIGVYNYHLISFLVSQNVQFDETQLPFKELPNSQAEPPIHQLSSVPLNLLSDLSSAQFSVALINPSTSQTNNMQPAVQLSGIEHTIQQKPIPQLNLSLLFLILRAQLQPNTIINHYLVPSMFDRI
jgi:hypothetical protein